MMTLGFFCLFFDVFKELKSIKVSFNQLRMCARGGLQGGRVKHGLTFFPYKVTF